MTRQEGRYSAEAEAKDAVSEAEIESELYSKSGVGINFPGLMSAEKAFESLAVERV